ncbi:hypothetical protein [Pseudosporangium ferrugineum]|uniref:PPE family protein n=1 Tax=Pseudosporangium ferrugineum TaxID=439699 RepID=A0A2T0S465_9ACTN|nr:hypothetical protein [Pseudosporangium ferrugineum]PRY28214.1 hypothetical protein CLV70_1086 [Pseudosporangium ferrugineum]
MSDEVLSSSWCTAWGSYNTPRLWAMVADEDDPESWRQVAAWGEISGSVKDQRNLLRKARESLVAAWPPEDNKSAAAFVEELDILIARMDTARADADDTATGLANILEALRQAKNNIKPLYEQYKEKNEDIVPSWWDNAEDKLDEKARTHMITAEGIVQDNVARLKVPDPYVLEPDKPKGGGRPLGEPSPQQHSGGGSSGSRGGGADPIPVPHDPVPPLPGRDATIPDGVDPVPSPGDGPSGGGPGAGSTGPGLAGVITPAPVTPPGGQPGPVPGPGGLPAGGGGGIVPPMPGPIVGGGGGGGRGGTLRGVTGIGGPGGTANGLGGVGRGAQPPGVRPAAGRALPSGAVIGETVAGSGRGVAGGPGRGIAGGPGSVGGVSGRGATGRGGVSGRTRAGALGEAERTRPPRPSWLPQEPGGSRAGATTGLTGSARGNRRAGDNGADHDPDNPWQVAEGVDPVIAPDLHEATHDPGPNVIGWRG